MQQMQIKEKKLLVGILAGILALCLVVLGILLWLMGEPSGEPVDTEPEPQLQETEPPTTKPPSVYQDVTFIKDENGFITCPEKNAVTGIDVSAFQGNIDWKQVKNSGVEFVFIRVGYRGNTEGGLFEDSRAQEYYKGAKKAGLKVGAYFFSQAISAWEAEQEAWFVLKQVANWELDLPVVYDWEWVSNEARTARLSGAVLTSCTKAFCTVIEDAGLQSMVYFNTNQALKLLDMKKLQDYPFWLAQYTDAIDLPFEVDYWQYSCTGSVPGIETEVDLNLYFPE